MGIGAKPQYGTRKIFPPNFPAKIFKVMPKGKRRTPRRKNTRRKPYSGKRSKKRTYGAKRAAAAVKRAVKWARSGRRTKRSRVSTRARTVPQPSGPYRSIASSIVPRKLRRKLLFEDWQSWKLTAGNFFGAVGSWRMNNPIDPFTEANWKHMARGLEQYFKFYEKYRVMGATVMLWAEEQPATVTNAVPATFQIAAGANNAGVVVLAQLSHRMCDDQNADVSSMVLLPKVAGSDPKQPLWLEFLSSTQNRVKIFRPNKADGYAPGAYTTQNNTVGQDIVSGGRTAYPLGRPSATFRWRNNRAGYPGVATNSVVGGGAQAGSYDPWSLTYNCIPAGATGATPVGAGPLDINSPKLNITVARPSAAGLNVDINVRVHIRIEYDIEFTVPSITEDPDEDLDERPYAEAEGDGEDNQQQKFFENDPGGAGNEAYQMIGPDGVITSVQLNHRARGGDQNPPPVGSFTYTEFP